MRVRVADVGEAGVLSELAVRSKGHWGYDDDFLDAVRDELRVTEASIADGRVLVAVDDTDADEAPVLAGFVEIGGSSDDDAEVNALFVDPSAIGIGAGALLFLSGVELARSLGFTRLVIDADPYAAGFYEHVGAVLVGTSPSGSIPGRELPRYEYTLR